MDTYRWACFLLLEFYRPHVFLFLLKFYEMETETETETQTDNGDKASGHGPGSGEEQWPGGQSKPRFRARLIQRGTKSSFGLFRAMSAC